MLRAGTEGLQRCDGASICLQPPLPIHVALLSFAPRACLQDARRLQRGARRRRPGAPLGAPRQHRGFLAAGPVETQGGQLRCVRKALSGLLVNDTAASGRRIHEREHEDITTRAGGRGSRFWSSGGVFHRWSRRSGLTMSYAGRLFNGMPLKMDKYTNLFLFLTAVNRNADVCCCYKSLLEKRFLLQH